MQVGGDLTTLLDASEPDLVLNAVVGFAGVGATLWALERGVTLALANKESLVAAGDLAVAAWKRGGGLLLPVDSEHSALFQCLEGRPPGTVDSVVLTASGGPFRNRSLEDLESVTVEEALAHPTWSMGPKITVDSATLANKGLELIEAHYLFGLPYERIEVVVHPTSVVHALVRFRDGAALAHVGYPDMRVPISFALTHPERMTTSVPGLDFSAGLRLEFEPPDIERFPLLALARASGERGGTYPCAFNAANEVAVAAFLDGRIGFPEIAALVHDALDEVDGAPARRSRRARRGRRAGTPPHRAKVGSSLSIFISILGLALLILVHEAGHFFASLAVGLRPRRFYIGFPPAIAKTTRRGIEYGIGAIPLGGFVSIPGMHRPIPHDAERRFSRAVEDAPTLAGPVDRVKRALDGDDLEAGLSALDDLEDALRVAAVSPAALASAEKGLTELRDALGPDAYWKAATWRRLVAIAAGPAANIALTIAIFTFLFMTVAGAATRVVGTVAPEIQAGVTSPAQAIGLKAGDRIIAINGQPVKADEIADTIGESGGKELTLTVVRSGEELQLGPVAGQLVDERYRLGFGLEGTGLGFFPAVGQAVEITGLVAKEIVKSLGRLLTGDGRDEVSSPIGITQASSDAVERGADSYLWVLGLISLSLALLNLLPLLPLDGGHILFTLIEGARGKFLKREIYERVSVVGLAVVLLLFFVGLSNDIGKLS